MDNERLRAVGLSADLESWPTGRLLVVAGRMAYQGFQDLLGAHGVTVAGLQVLGALRDGPRAQVEIAARCGVRTQTAGRTIARLVSQGLLTRHPDPADRRRQLAELTARGRRLVTTLDEGAGPAGRTADTLGTSLFADLPDEERFRRDLLRIIRRLLTTQAAGRAAHWTAVAERWAAQDDELSAQTDHDRVLPHEEVQT